MRLLIRMGACIRGYLRRLAVLHARDAAGGGQPPSRVGMGRKGQQAGCLKAVNADGRAAFCWLASGLPEGTRSSWYLVRCTTCKVLSRAEYPSLAAKRRQALKRRVRLRRRTHTPCTDSPGKCLFRSGDRSREPQWKAVPTMPAQCTLPRCRAKCGGRLVPTRTQSACGTQSTNRGARSRRF